MFATAGTSSRMDNYVCPLTLPVGGGTLAVIHAHPLRLNLRALGLDEVASLDGSALALVLRDVHEGARTESSSKHTSHSSHATHATGPW